MLSKVAKKFSKVDDPLKTNRPRVPIEDCLMSGLAVFSLKYPSLLAFNQAQEQECISKNLEHLFKVSHVPSDTYLRERLDVIEPLALRPAYKTIFTALQRGKALEEYVYFNNSYLLSIDGTGLFSSHEIQCEQCNVKNHKDGSKTYYHQMLSAVLVHPENKAVIPLAPEPILKGDGTKKNDCERNAAKRLLHHIRREHPHLKLTVIEDGLSSNGPHIRLLKELGMQFILGVKPKDHTFLFEWIEHAQCIEYEKIDEDGTKHRYRFINGVPLNDANFNLEVNFLEYWEIKSNGKEQHFSWVTDIKLSENNVKKVMKGGRARWKIENETFNTLKNQGYHFEHNFGHGCKNLCTVFAFLMMLAFLIDQVQQLCCCLFQGALRARKRKKYLWERLRNFFTSFIFKRWEDLYLTLIHGIPEYEICWDTS